MRINLTKIALLAAFAVACSEKGGSSGAYDGQNFGDGDETGGEETGETGGGETGTTDDTGEETTDGEVTPPTIDIAGDWTDAYGGAHTFTDTLWTYDDGYGSVSEYSISVYDNEENYFVAENGPTAWSVGWSRFDWTTGADGSYYYCQATYDAATEADAIATTTSDDTAPGDGGCGDFAWTGLTAVAGD